MRTVAISPACQKAQHLALNVRRDTSAITEVVPQLLDQAVLGEVAEHARVEQHI
jgi:hypothetical protein